MTNVAVIGAGRWGRNILRVLANQTEITYIAHRGSDETQAHIEREYPESIATGDYRNALRDAKVEAVFIATPIPTHAAIAEDALRAGKHVFVEKPLSLERSTVDALYALAHKNDRTLFTGYVYCYDPAFIMLTKECAGAHMHIETLWKKYGTFDSPIVENLLVHDIALATKLLGAGVLTTLSHSADFFEGRYEAANGTAHITIDRASQEKIKSITVDVENARYVHTDSTLIKWTGGTEQSLYQGHGNEVLRIELETFLEDTKHGSTTNAERQLIDVSVATTLSGLATRPS